MNNLISAIMQTLSKEKAEKISLTNEQIAELLKTSPEAVKEFENAYKIANFNNGISDNLFKINAKQIGELRDVNNDSSPEASELVKRIVYELLAQTVIYEYNPESKSATVIEYDKLLSDKAPVTLDDVKMLPSELQPDLTGQMMKVDIPDSGTTLLSLWKDFKACDNRRKAKGLYDHFRQGLDILDIDNLTYAMIDTNPNSMGNWLPQIVGPVDSEGFFKIPATKIVKVPLTMLQLTRLDYMQFSKTTMDIVNEFCRLAFDLDESKDYFIKTGTYSNKFDFRNVRVNSPKEIRELGEYLLYIHWQALQMAHYDLSGRHQPVIYGVSTTNEWVVRDFIPDCEDNLEIYHGLPLRTEYRVFVDFDSDKVIGVNPYWDPKVMKDNFERKASTDIDAKHDYITYKANEEKLMKRYNDNVDKVTAHIEAILPEIDLHGQYSIDVMQNGNDFYIIDMAIAENSAHYECVPENLRIRSEENWLPKLPKNE